MGHAVFIAARMMEAIERIYQETDHPRPAPEPLADEGFDECDADADAAAEDGYCSEEVELRHKKPGEGRPPRPPASPDPWEGHG